jgi:hypothetical protein
MAARLKAGEDKYMGKIYGRSEWIAGGIKVGSE